MAKSEGFAGFWDTLDGHPDGVPGMPAEIFEFITSWKAPVALLLLAGAVALLRRSGGQTATR